MSGYRRARIQGQAAQTGKVETYAVAAAHATRLTQGDVVRITGTSITTGNDNLQLVDAAAAGQSITGVIVDVDFTLAGENLTVASTLAASTAGTVKVELDTNQLFDVDVENGPLVLANVGFNADIVANASTLTGAIANSNMTLDASTVADTQTLQFRIEKLLPNETDGTVDGTRARVRMNNTTVNDGAAGV